MEEEDFYEDTEPVEDVPSYEDTESYEGAEEDLTAFDKLSAFGHGASEGLSMGFRDEIVGGVKAAGETLGDLDIEKFPERYRTHRDADRQSLSEVREKAPQYYTGGQIAGGVGSAFIPGMGAGKLLKAAGMGAASGLGLSQADLTKGEYEEAIGDVGEGALTGGLVYGGVKAAGAAKKALSPKRISKAYLGLPEGAYERIVKNPQKVEAALAKKDNFYGLPEISERLTNRINQLRQEVLDGSKASREILKKENPQIPEKEILRIYNKTNLMMKADEGRIPNEAHNFAKGIINKQIKKLSKLHPKEPMEELYSFKYPIKNIPQRPTPLAPKPEASMTGAELMDRIREIRQSVDFKKAAGEIDPRSEAILKKMQRELDQLLKDSSPAYRQAMAETAQAASLLERARPLAKSDQGAMNFVNAVDRQGNKFKGDVLKELDARFKDNLFEDSMDAIAARVVDRSAPQGSQRVNLFSKMGKAVGGLLPGPAGTAGESAGASFGAYVDSFGRRMAIPIAKTSSVIDRMMEKGLIFGPAKRAIEKASEKGAVNKALTFDLMVRNNPELKRLFDLEMEMEEEEFEP